MIEKIRPIRFCFFVLMLFCCELTILNMCFMLNKLLLFSQVRSTECTIRMMCTTTLPLHLLCCGPNSLSVCNTRLVSVILFIKPIYLIQSNTVARFYHTNLFSAGSVVDQDPTERLHLMSGRYSPVKIKNVVPHDIGDPGRIKKNNLISYST